MATVGLAQLLLTAVQSLPVVDTDAAQIRYPAAISRRWSDVAGLSIRGADIQVLVVVPTCALGLAWWFLVNVIDDLVEQRSSAPCGFAGLGGALFANLVPSIRYSDAYFQIADTVLDTVLSTKGVTVRFGGHEIVGLIGMNGAGKSTLMNASGGNLASTGRIELLGSDVSGLSTTRRAQRGLGRYADAFISDRVYCLESGEHHCRRRTRAGAPTTGPSSAATAKNRRCRLPRPVRGSQYWSVPARG